MRKTYAYNGITLGIVLGLFVGVATGSGVLAVIAMIVLSVLCFAGIRLLENAVDAGVDKAANAIKNKYNERNNSQWQ